MKESLLENIKTYKEKYKQEGFYILGIFGSYARNEETVHSDIDILFDTSENFLEQYKGWEVFGRIETIKKELETYLGNKVDLVDKESLDDKFIMHIEKEIVYV